MVKTSKKSLDDPGEKMKGWKRRGSKEREKRKKEERLDEEIEALKDLVSDIKKKIEALDPELENLGEKVKGNLSWVRKTIKGLSSGVERLNPDRPGNDRALFDLKDRLVDLLKQVESLAGMRLYKSGGIEAFKKESEEKEITGRKERKTRGSLSRDEKETIMKAFDDGQQGGEEKVLPPGKAVKIQKEKNDTGPEDEESKRRVELSDRLKKFEDGLNEIRKIIALADNGKYKIDDLELLKNGLATYERMIASFKNDLDVNIKTDRGYDSLKNNLSTYERMAASFKNDLDEKMKKINVSPDDSGKEIKGSKKKIQTEGGDVKSVKIEKKPAEKIKEIENLRDQIKQAYKGLDDRAVDDFLKSVDESLEAMNKELVVKKFHLINHRCDILKDKAKIYLDEERIKRMKTTSELKNKRKAGESSKDLPPGKRTSVEEDKLGPLGVLGGKGRPEDDKLSAPGGRIPLRDHKTGKELDLSKDGELPQAIADKAKRIVDNAIFQKEIMADELRKSLMLLPDEALPPDKVIELDKMVEDAKRRSEAFKGSSLERLRKKQREPEIEVAKFTSGIKERKASKSLDKNMALMEEMVGSMQGEERQRGLEKLSYFEDKLDQLEKKKGKGDVKKEKDELLQEMQDFIDKIESGGFALEVKDAGKSAIKETGESAKEDAGETGETVLPRGKRDALKLFDDKLSEIGDIVDSLQGKERQRGVEKLSVFEDRLTPMENRWREKGTKEEAKELLNEMQAFIKSGGLASADKDAVKDSGKSVKKGGADEDSFEKLSSKLVKAGLEKKGTKEDIQGGGDIDFFADVDFANTGKAAEVSQGDIVEEKPAEKEILDIPDNVLFELMGKDNLNGILEFLVNGKADIAENAMRYIFVGENYNEDKLNEAVKKFGYTAEEFIKKWESKFYKPAFEIAEKWVAQETAKQVNKSIGLMDRVKVSAADIAKLAALNILPRSAVVFGAASVVAPFGGMISRSVSGLVGGLAGGLKKVGKIKQWFSKQSEKARERINKKMELLKQQKAEDVILKTRVWAELESRLKNFSAMLSQGLREESGKEVLPQGTDVNLELAIREVNEIRETDGDENVKKLRGILLRLSVEDKELTQKIKENLGNETKLGAALKKVEGIRHLWQDMGEDFEGKDSKKKSGLKALAGYTAGGGLIGLASSYSPLARAGVGALLGGIAGSEFGRRRDISVRKKEIEKNISARLEEMTRQVEIYNNSENEEERNRIMQSLSFELPKLREALNSGIFSQDIEKQSVLKNLIRRIESYRIARFVESGKQAEPTEKNKALEKFLASFKLEEASYNDIQKKNRDYLLKKPGVLHQAVYAGVGAIAGGLSSFVLGMRYEERIHPSAGEGIKEKLSAELEKPLPKDGETLVGAPHDAGVTAGVEPTESSPELERPSLAKEEITREQVPAGAAKKLIRPVEPSTIEHFVKVKPDESAAATVVKGGGGPWGAAQKLKDYFEQQGVKWHGAQIKEELQRHGYRWEGRKVYHPQVIHDQGAKLVPWVDSEGKGHFEFEDAKGGEGISEREWVEEAKTSKVPEEIDSSKIIKEPEWAKGGPTVEEYKERILEEEAVARAQEEHAQEAAKSAAARERISELAEKKEFEQDKADFGKAKTEFEEEAAKSRAAAARIEQANTVGELGEKKIIVPPGYEYVERAKGKAGVLEQRIRAAEAVSNLYSDDENSRGIANKILENQRKMAEDFLKDVKNGRPINEIPNPQWNQQKFYDHFYNDFKSEVRKETFMQKILKPAMEDKTGPVSELRETIGEKINLASSGLPGGSPLVEGLEAKLSVYAQDHPKFLEEVNKTGAGFNPDLYPGLDLDVDERMLLAASSPEKAIEGHGILAGALVDENGNVDKTLKVYAPGGDGANGFVLEDSSGRKFVPLEEGQKVSVVKGGKTGQKYLSLVKPNGERAVLTATEVKKMSAAQ